MDKQDYLTSWAAFKDKVNLRAFSSHMVVRRGKKNLTEEEQKKWFEIKMSDFAFRMKAELGDKYDSKYGAYIGDVRSQFLAKRKFTYEPTGKALTNEAA